MHIISFLHRIITVTVSLVICGNIHNADATTSHLSVAMTLHVNNIDHPMNTCETEGKAAAMSSD